MRRAAGWLCALGLLALAACEPSGEGALSASVQASRATGAVVIELTGSGITGFEGAGDVRVFSGPVDPRATRHSLVAVSASGERIRFRVLVEDVGAAPPTALVRSAVDADNAPIESLGGYEVRIAR